MELNYPISDDDDQPYLVRVTLTSKADKPLECWFLWREENRRTRRKTLGAGTKTNNKLNPHLTPGPGIEPRPQWWEASAVTTVPSLHPLPVYLHSKVFLNSFFSFILFILQITEVGTMNIFMFWINKSGG